MTEDKSVVAEEAEIVADEAEASDDDDFADVDLSDIEDTSTEDEASAAESDESPEEDVAEESEESEPEVEEESQDEPEAEAEESEEAAEDDTPSESPEEAQKRFNDEMAKRRIAERQLQQERERREQENLERYLREAEDDDAEYARRQQEIAQHQIMKERIALTSEKLQVGIDKALANIDLFKSGTPEQKEELAKRLDTFEALYVQKDQNGNFLSVNADVYQYLQNEADSIKKLSGIGARQQVKNKANEKARTLTRPVKTPKPVKADPELEGFDEEANRW